MPNSTDKSSRATAKGAQALPSLSVSSIAIASVDALFSVVFGDSRQAAFPEALEFCQRAAIFQAGTLLGRRRYYATFANTAEQTVLAHGAMRALHCQAGVRIFLRGKEFKRPLYQVFGVLDCYVTSCRCVDYRAHCHQIVQLDRPDDTGDSDDFMFPCRYLRRQAGAYELDRRHPSSLQDQAQALAVAAGCEWCPRFDVRVLQKVGSDIIDV